MKQNDLTEDQRRQLDFINTWMPVESVKFIVLHRDPVHGYAIKIDQDTLPVIRAYLDLIEECMNG